MIELLLRLLVVAVAIGLATTGSWFLHTRDWPSFVIVSLDIALWVTVGGSLVGLLRNRHNTDEQVVRSLRNRARTRHR